MKESFLDHFAKAVHGANAVADVEFEIVLLCSSIWADHEADKANKWERVCDVVFTEGLKTRKWKLLFIFRSDDLPEHCAIKGRSHDNVGVCPINGLLRSDLISKLDGLRCLCPRGYKSVTGGFLIKS